MQKNRVSLLDSEIPRLVVNFLIRYVKMFNLDAEGQILSLMMSYNMDWRDPRLTWDPDDFSNISMIFSTVDNVWLPDLQLGNTLVLCWNLSDCKKGSKSLDSLHPDTPKTIRIMSNGTVIMPIVVYLEAACALKVGTFPFDKQSCPIPVGSLAYDFKHLYTTGSVESVSLENPGNGEWIMTNVSFLSYMQSANIQVMAPVFDLKRVPNYYVYVIALPCFVMTMLAIVGMYWTPNVKSGQLVKLSIGLTSLVSMTVLLDMLSTSIPKTSVFPLLGIYVVICVGITSFACVIVVVYPHPKPREIKLRKQNEEIGARTRYQQFFHTIKEMIFQRHFALQLFFQTMNLTAFIVFLSFWD